MVNISVNTRAAEVLYTKVGDLCGLNEETIVFDMCCGTGTIALSLAKVCFSLAPI